ncbi:MAG: ATP-dependent DNA helicase RecQ [Planctomycetota bacterium]
MGQTVTDIDVVLKEQFGLEDFRLGQRRVIEAAIAGRDVLCVMPTGAGKSLCYQLPALVKGGLTLVVSPLVSLMADQVRQLEERGQNALLFNSTLSAGERRDVIGQLRDGFGGLLYVAPERFNDETFLDLLAGCDLRLFAVDEAHCISQWGHDFRPEYQQLGPVVARLGSGGNRPTCLALTATATADVRNDIRNSLELDDPLVQVSGFDRPNLGYHTVTAQKIAEKQTVLMKLVRENKGSGIVYCSTRKNVDEVTSLLAGTCPGRTVVAYHAGMDDAARTANQRTFMDTPDAVAVATNAFGMGINKPDIRFVIHYNLPGTLEAYYQEAGRAGRDGRAATCTLLYSFADKRTQDFFISKIGERGEVEPDRIADLQERANAKLESVIRFARQRRCRRQMILDYFGDDAEIECHNCDVCGGGAAVLDNVVEVPEHVTLAIRQLLSAIARLHRRFGLGTVAEVLAGSESEKMTRWRLNEQTTFGLMRDRSIKQIIAMLHRVMESGLARQVDPENARRPVVELTNPGLAVMKGEAPPPATLADLIPRQRRLAAVPVRRSVENDFDVDHTPEARERFERLRQMRTRLANEADVPAYVIASNRTLEAIATAEPTNEEELESVPGMGPKKVAQYGEHILAALQ